MTLKEFLEMNTNGHLLGVYIHDKQDKYILFETKTAILDKNIFIDKIILSFKVYKDGLYIKLDT
jgi:hypothetical protein